MEDLDLLRRTVMGDIARERCRQQELWGDEFDSKNTPNDWLAYILRYAGKALTLSWDRDIFRTSLVKTAALCVAAIEWCDRTDGMMPPRHYDEEPN